MSGEDHHHTSQPGRTDSEYDPADEGWDDWCEEAEEMKCLFCKETFLGARDVFNHMHRDHSFDFQTLKLSLKLDFYQCVRAINYIRQLVLDNPEMEESSDFTITANAPFLNDDSYMKPVLENDALLYAFEDVHDGSMTDASFVSTRQRRLSTRSITGEDMRVIGDPRGEQAELLRRMRLLEMTLKAKETELTRVQRQHDEYRAMVKEQFFDCHESEATEVTEEKPASDYYFTSYAHYEIHEQMLKDTIRTESYRDFMYDNKHVFAGKVVLDVGCGTGILSMFAARAGAKRVIAVDNSDIIGSARKIAAENGFGEEKITFIRGKIEEIKLPVDTVDIIISEWMGYFLLYEAMLDSVLTARDRYLAPGGFMAPSGSSIHLTLLEDEEYYNDKFNYWNDVYGFKMLTMRDPLFLEAGVEVVDPAGIFATKPCCLQDLDLNKVTARQLDFTSPFSIEASRAATLHAFVGYFDIVFDNSKEWASGDDVQTVFSTGPLVKSTHWKQTLFPLRAPLKMEAGDIVQGTFKCCKDETNPRELSLQLDYWVTAADGKTIRVERQAHTYNLR